MRPRKKILEHTEDLSFGEFRQDELTIDAVLYNFVIIGEAANSLPAEIWERYPNIPWRDMKDMRNIIVHEYFGLDLSIIWQTIQQDLVELAPQLEEIIESN